MKTQQLKGAQMTLFERVKAKRQKKCADEKMDECI